jgi:hypothetical protein
MSNTKCSFCDSDYWSFTDGENIAVFFKDVSGGEIHLKCYRHIVNNPEEKKVKIHSFKRYLETYDWEKMKKLSSNPLTPDGLREEMGLTKEDVK